MAFDLLHFSNIIFLLKNLLCKLLQDMTITYRRYSDHY